MTDISIRPLDGEERLDVHYNHGMYAFRASPPFQDKEEWAKIVRERKGVTCHALFEDGYAVASAASTSMTQNVRGKLFPASGVWGVATLPAARRKGYSKQVLSSLLSAGKEAGEIFSNLYPFRESFYERLGYVTHPLPIIARFSPSALAPLLGKDFVGEVELKLIGDAFETYREYLTKMRLHTHGMAFFDVGDKMVAQQNKLWVALAKVDGEIEGLMLYNLQGEEVTKFNFCAYRFYSKTGRGRYLLLEWIARHIDQADRVEIWLPPYEHPETWLADIQVKTESQVRAPMSRVLDVANIGGVEVGDGNFSAHVSDPICPFNDGKWKFESVDGRLQVSKAEDSDCELTIQGLTALIFGTHDPQDFPLRGWGNPIPEIQTVMRGMFPKLCPFLHENF
ncbi:MAG: GNAT family N-acetyltransferase [Chloroflexi bacterium]|nr:GNAT family N-acetyltransferase [Chloroflexota bacterium]